MAKGAIPVGVAHHVPIYSAYSFLDEPARKILEWHTTFWFHDLIVDKVLTCKLMVLYSCGTLGLTASSQPNSRWTFAA